MSKAKKTKSEPKKHPIQPLEMDDGVLRFKPNAIVNFLLRAGPYDLNKLIVMDFSSEDWEQFAQLIGYSLSGFGELSYVSNETYEAAAKMGENGPSEQEARIAHLEETLESVREGLRSFVPSVFKIHVDDLQS